MHKRKCVFFSDGFPLRPTGSPQEAVHPQTFAQRATWTENIRTGQEPGHLKDTGKDLERQRDIGHQKGHELLKGTGHQKDQGPRKDQGHRKGQEPQKGQQPQKYQEHRKGTGHQKYQGHLKGQDLLKDTKKAFKILFGSIFSFLFYAFTKWTFDAILIFSPRLPM